MAARLAIAGHKVLLLDAGDDQGNATVQQVPALQLQSTEYEDQKWDYFVNHYQDLERQEKDSKMTYKTPSGDLHVGPNAPANSEPLGILYPRAGTLGGCSTHNAMMLDRSILPMSYDLIDANTSHQYHLPIREGLGGNRHDHRQQLMVPRFDA